MTRGAGATPVNGCTIDEGGIDGALRLARMAHGVLTFVTVTIGEAEGKLANLAPNDPIMVQCLEAAEYLIGRCAQELTVASRGRGE